MNRREFLGIAALGAVGTACSRRATQVLTPTGMPIEASPTPEPPPARAKATWSRIDVRGPRARRDHTLTAVGSSIYLFGGRAGGEPFGDLWRYEDGSGWERIRARGGPSTRFGHNAVAIGREIMIFGGQGEGAQFFDDVWAFDVDRRKWVNATPDGDGPDPRYGAGATVRTPPEAPESGRPADHMVVSHGFSFSGRFDDSWVLTDRWERLSSGPERPVKRCLHRLVFVPMLQEAVLFGGQTDGTPFLGDTWILNPWTGRWREVAIEGPGARNLYAAGAFIGSLHIFGGNTADGPSDDVWRFDGERWARVKIEGDFGPGPRFGIEGAILDAPGAPVMRIFGGTDGERERDDLWELLLPG